MQRHYGRVGIVVAVIVVALIVRQHGSPPATTASSAQKLAATPGIGHSSTDGKLAFDLSRVDCGVPDIGTKAVHVSPGHGYQFCVVSVTVSDVSSDEVVFYDEWQRAYTSNGATYNVDPGGEYFLAGDKSGTHMQPGNKIHAELPFKIPSGAKLDFLDFHDDAFSEGVLIKA